MVNFRHDSPPSAVAESDPHRAAAKLRILGLAVGAVFLSQLLLTGYLHATSGDLRDFGSGFITAQRVLTRGWDDLYDLQDQVAEQQSFYQRIGAPTPAGMALPFIYAPVALFIFMPLAPFQPAPLAYTLWICLNFLLAASAITIVLRRVELPRSLTLPTSALIVLGYAPLAMGLVIGQSVGFTVLLYTLAFLAFWRGSDRLGACCLALLMMIKPQLIVGAILLLLVQRRWRAITTFVAAGIVLAFATLALVGPDGVTDYLTTIKRMDNFFGMPEYGMSTAAMVNWRSVVARLPGMTEGVGSAAIGALALATLGLVAWVWRRPGLEGEPFVRAFLVFTAAGLLSGYHDHYQDLGTLVPPALALFLLHRREVGRMAAAAMSGAGRTALGLTEPAAASAALALLAAVLLVVFPSGAWLVAGPHALVRTWVLASLAAPGLLCTIAAGIVTAAAARPSGDSSQGSASQPLRSPRTSE
jgi:hypothetical protein